MAASMPCPMHISKNLDKLHKASKKAKNNKKKNSKKNILISPFKLEWPVVDADTENKILDALTVKLSEFPRLEKARKRGGINTEGNEEDEEGDDLVRQRLRCQLVLGHCQVCKGLERDQLSLILVWAAAQPPFLIRSLLPLAASRACPAFFLPNLVPRITEATGLSSLVAMGFKKSNSGLNDFASFVSMAVQLAPPLSIPWISQQKLTSPADESNDTIKEVAVEQVQQEEKIADTLKGNGNEKNVKGMTEESVNQDDAVVRSLLSPDEEKELLEKLIGFLQPYKSVFKKPKPRFTNKEWKAQRKLIRGHLVMDPFAICSAARSEQLKLLLVQKDDPVPNPVLSSVIVCMRQKGCPVVHLASLKKNIAPIVRNPLLKAVGFRSCKDSTAQMPTDFTEIISYAARFLPSDRKSFLTSMTEGSYPKEKLILQPEIKKTSQPKKVPPPFYNVSHLYVYKTDLHKSVPGTTSVNTSDDQKVDSTFSISEKPESYISLTSKPTVQILGRKLQREATSDPVLQSSATKSSIRNEKLTASNLGMEESSVEETAIGGQSFMGVMGVEVTDSAVASCPFYPQASKNKNKSNLKRKLQSNAESGDFVSFKLIPTNVQTSIANPCKKKKKKKKRK